MTCGHDDSTINIVMIFYYYGIYAQNFDMIHIFKLVAM